MDAKARLNFAIISPSSVDEEKGTRQALEGRRTSRDMRSTKNLGSIKTS